MRDPATESDGARGGTRPGLCVPACSLGQGSALGFREKRQHGEAQQEKSKNNENGFLFVSC